jgi:beta-glucosidase
MARNTTDEQLQSILEQMTLSEKVSLLSGKDMWHTMPIPRLGISNIVMTDGPHGVRTGPEGAGRVLGPTTAFPTGVSMASTWNRDLIKRVGAALAAETRRLGCHVLLCPCVNIVRTPLAGRNFETYSEDPYLAGQIGIAYVNGLQSRSVGASLKHFAANNQEYERFRGNSVIDERTLREIYLAAFELIVKDAKPWTVMCSYNRVNGSYASENEVLLRKILKDEWGFEGPVISDWGAVHNIYQPISAGLDLEMPGPARYFGKALEAAVSNWQVSMADIDDAVLRMLRLLEWSGIFGEDTIEDSDRGQDEHRSLARVLAYESIVLLKNDANHLPLKREKIKKLAVIGMNAVRMVSGGGSSRVEPQHWVTPLEGLQTKLGDSVEIVYEPGYDNRVTAVPVPVDRFSSPGMDDPGLQAAYYNNMHFSGEPDLIRIDNNINFWWGGGGPALGVVDEKHYSVRWRGFFTAPETGETEFVLSNTGYAKIWLDGTLILENDIGVVSNTGVDLDKTAVRAVKFLEKGIKYPFEAVFISGEDNPYALVNLTYVPPLGVEGDLIQRAVELAESSDAVVVFAGLPDLFESEGSDRPDLLLPGKQDALIRAVTAVNTNTVVVINACAPIEMPWVDAVDTLLLAYYPGQEGGHALADILFGDVNPSGKLTVTYPKHLEDNPAYPYYPGGRDVHYGEGVFVGYRYYDTKEVEPLFPFGHGLSYSSFEYQDLSVPDVVNQGENFKVSVSIKNTGKVYGQDVVQLYIRDQEASVVRPEKELKGFEKIGLHPGEAKTITFDLNPRSLSFYDVHQESWVAEPGVFEVLVGSSSRDIRLHGSFELV